MKVRIDKDDLWPYYFVDPNPAYVMLDEVPDTQLERWAKTMQEFKTMQAEMAEVYNAMNERNKYFFDPKRIDLNVLRKEAVKQSSDQRFEDARPVVIHHHAAGESCDNKEHERYEGGERV